METANHGPWDGITRRGGRKVAIIGAGNVGATTAYALVLSGLCSEIVVVDIDAARAAGIRCGAVTWGYADAGILRAQKPDFVFEAMADIAAAFQAPART